MISGLSYLSVHQTSLVRSKAATLWWPSRSPQDFVFMRSPFLRGPEIIKVIQRHSSPPRFPRRCEWQEFCRLITHMRREFDYTGRHIESNPLPPDSNDDAVSPFVRRNHAKRMLVERDNFGCVWHAVQNGVMAKHEVKSQGTLTNPTGSLASVSQRK